MPLFLYARALSQTCLCAHTESPLNVFLPPWTRRARTQSQVRCFHWWSAVNCGKHWAIMEPVSAFGKLCRTKLDLIRRKMQPFRGCSRCRAALEKGSEETWCGEQSDLSLLVKSTCLVRVVAAPCGGVDQAENQDQEPSVLFPSHPF